MLQGINESNELHTHTRINPEKSWAHILSPSESCSGGGGLSDSAEGVCVVCVCVQWIHVREEMWDVTLFWLLEALALQVYRCISGNTQTHDTHTRTHTHSWDAGVLDMAQHFSRWPGCYAISHHSNMLSFPSFSLSFSPSLSSAKRRKMADKILPQRVRLHIFTFVAVCFSLCVFFILCALHRKNPGRFFDVWGSWEAQRARWLFVISKWDEGGWGEQIWRFWGFFFFF